MKIDHWKNRDAEGMMLKVGKKEAYSIMQSLANQLVDENPNSHRNEYDIIYSDPKNKKQTIYFSIVIGEE